MKMQIKHRYNGTVLFETDAETLRAAVVSAVAAKANLSGANLSGAYLRGANLSGANLSGADLSGANLSGAYLRGADLSGAYLSGAYLSGACLSGAYLSGANLSGANLSGETLNAWISQRTILPEGDLIVWKKLRGDIICKLKIPAKAKRVGGLIGRKCRAEYAIVLSGSGKSKYDGMEYKKGKKVIPDSYDPNPLVECSHGIHFFITKQEAEQY